MPINSPARCLVLAALLTAATTVASADDWARFRGPNGSGKAPSAKVPLSWSETENIKWKLELPGPGSSSPIVFGDRVFVVCYSGYGGDADAGSLDDLKRHLICIDRETGQELWTATDAAESPEDPYRGFINEHGYASNTPVADGERVFAFFGKSGVAAFAMNGQQLWHVEVGKESSGRRWGSAASLILHKNLLIVPAAEESQSLRALDMQTGKEVWKSEAASLELAYGTPALVETEDGRTEMVLAVPGELWGFNPDDGALNWYVETDFGSPHNPSVIVEDGLVYALSGRGGRSVAVRPGGKDDVTDSHVLWTAQHGSYVPSPVFHEGHLYWFDDGGILHCVDARSGELVKRQRVGGEGGGGRGRGRAFYASIVLAGDRLYVVSRTGGTHVFSATPELEQLAHNTIASDDSDFNATPAIGERELYLRSNRSLYCVAEKDQ